MRLTLTGRLKDRSQALWDYRNNKLFPINTRKKHFSGLGEDIRSAQIGRLITAALVLLLSVIKAFACFGEVLLSAVGSEGKNTISIKRDQALGRLTSFAVQRPVT